MEFLLDCGVGVVCEVGHQRMDISDKLDPPPPPVLAIMHWTGPAASLLRPAAAQFSGSICCVAVGPPHPSQHLHSAP